MDPLEVSTVPLWRHPAFLLALGFFALRVAYLPWCELFPEEAYYWNYAQHLDYGYLDHPPMVAWLIALGTKLCGHHEWGVRLAALACSALTSFFAYRLTEIVTGDRHSARASLVLTQGLPFFFVAGWMMTPDAPLTACWAAMLYALAQVFFAGNARAWLGVGLALGVGMLSKYTIALVGVSTVVFIMLDPASRVWLWRVAPYACVALAVAIFSPVIIWNARHHWASFAFQSVSRVEAAKHFSLFELLGAVIVLLTPTGAGLAVRLVARASPINDASRRRARFARVFVLVPLTVFVLFSLTHHVKLNWTGPLWLALVPALASWCVAAEGIWRVARNVTAAASAAAYLGLLQYLAFGLLGVGYSPHIERLPVAWRELAAELAAQQATLQDDGAPGPVRIVGMDRDFIASEVAFYHPDETRAVDFTTGSHVFDGESLMYAFWRPAALEKGATLLLAGFDHKEIDSPRVTRHATEVSPVEEHVLSVRGKIVRKYYTRVVSGYRSERASR